MPTKQCPACKKRFWPSSRHKKCPSCRHKSQKHPCIDCGKSVGRIYTRCTPCANRVLRETKPVHDRKRRMNPAGYIYISLPDKSNYAEHRYIMEQVLGRKLIKGENVHHINGVKHDNRPENLELWVTNQPSGQRVSDLLDWAYEIVDRYGGGVES